MAFGASVDACAAMELYPLTHDITYKNKTLEFGQIIINCQQRTGINRTDPLAGLFLYHAKKGEFAALLSSGL